MCASIPRQVGLGLLRQLMEHDLGIGGGRGRGKREGEEGEGEEEGIPPQFLLRVPALTSFSDRLLPGSVS